MNKHVHTADAKSTASKQETVHEFSTFFNHFASLVTKAAGNVYTFSIAVIVVLSWALSGPFFKFSDTWQLVINTGTTIITFLMVFIIQHSQNRDSVALQLKLDELIATSSASNKLISVENLTDEDLEKIQRYFISLSDIAAKEKQNRKHSIEELKDQQE